jgi:hypothetical protein
MDLQTAETELSRSRLRERDAFKDEVISGVHEANRRQSAEDRAKAKILEYMEKFPELADKSSKLNAEVRGQYQNLLDLGTSESSNAQLLAIQSTLGSINRASGAMTKDADDFDRENREVSQEVSGGGRPSDGPRRKGLAPKQQEDYWTERGYSEEHKERLRKRHVDTKYSRIMRE